MRDNSLTKIKCTHGSHRNVWRWCPRRCSVARSDPASPASESGSSRVSPAAPSHGSRRRWTRSPAGTWTRSPALLLLLLLLTPGGGRRAETPGTPRYQKKLTTDHREQVIPRLKRKEERTPLEAGRGEDGAEGWMDGWRGTTARMVTFTHGCTAMQSSSPLPPSSLPLFLSSSLTQTLSSPQTFSRFSSSG